MTKDEILRKFEDDNEHHFHDVDRKWIMEAMEEYAEQQVKNCRIANVSNSEAELPCENQWCEDGWVMEIYGEKIPCGMCDRSHR